MTKIWIFPLIIMWLNCLYTYVAQSNKWNYYLSSLLYQRFWLDSHTLAIYTYSNREIEHSFDDINSKYLLRELLSDMKLYSIWIKIDGWRMLCVIIHAYEYPIWQKFTFLSIYSADMLCLYYPEYLVKDKYNALFNDTRENTGTNFYCDLKLELHIWYNVY